MRHPTVAAWNGCVMFSGRTGYRQMPPITQYWMFPNPSAACRCIVIQTAVMRDVDPESGWPEHILFEGARSGAGERADWQQAARVARQTCMMLAGGLTPDNVGDAIVQVHPWGVDVSSGVESAPGVKDPAKIAAFVAAARKAEDVHAG